MNLKALERSVILKTFTIGVLVAQFLSPAGVAFAAFGDGSPTVSNPSVFTNSDSKAKVDGSTGAFTQHISIDIPPGRNGMQPDLALDYNSQNTDDSIVGYQIYYEENSVVHSVGYGPEAADRTYTIELPKPPVTATSTAAVQ